VARASHERAGHGLALICGGGGRLVGRLWLVLGAVFWAFWRMVFWRWWERSFSFHAGVGGAAARGGGFGFSRGVGGGACVRCMGQGLGGGVVWVLGRGVGRCVRLARTGVWAFRRAAVVFVLDLVRRCVAGLDACVVCCGDGLLRACRADEFSLRLRCFRWQFFRAGCSVLVSVSLGRAWQGLWGRRWGGRGWLWRWAASWRSFWRFGAVAGSIWVLPLSWGRGSRCGLRWLAGIGGRRRSTVDGELRFGLVSAR